MLSIFGARDDRLVPLETGPHCEGLARHEVVWVDLLEPTREEELAVEKMLGFAIPTRQEMAEIEDSARLYVEGDASVMTAVVIHGVAEGRPARTQVTFVLTKDHLVSVRYADPVPFRTFQQKLQRQPEAFITAERVFVGLTESIVERVADVLEMVAAELNEVSTRLFIDAESKVRRARREEDELQVLIRRLGRKNMTVSILRESMLSLARLLPFVRTGTWLSNGGPARLKQVDRDLRSLATFEAQLSSEIGYLHEATQGLINLAQNRIIKVFSIAAVLFLPPTLVGTIYGMNFEVMPELKWGLGYPFAIFLMVISAILPFYWFKRQGWL